MIYAQSVDNLIFCPYLAKYYGHNRSVSRVFLSFTVKNRKKHVILLKGYKN